MSWVYLARFDARVVLSKLGSPGGVWLLLLASGKPFVGFHHVLRNVDPSFGSLRRWAFPYVSIRRGQYFDAILPPLLSMRISILRVVRTLIEVVGVRGGSVKATTNGTCLGVSVV